MLAPDRSPPAESGQHWYGLGGGVVNDGTMTGQEVAGAQPPPRNRLTA
jgi:hypothetical protein